MSSRMPLLGLALALGLGACHAPFDEVPLAQQKIYFSDRFFDVKALGTEKAIIVGYSGKILETSDGGYTFVERESGVEDRGIFNLAVQGDKVWACGQEGLIIHSTDGGETWKPQKSGVEEYLFSITFLDEDRGFAVGDRSILLRTDDGGENWTRMKLHPADESSEEVDEDLALAMQDPIFYDLAFVNDRVGWIVGEFGRILKTTDGGTTWVEQQSSLLGDETGIVDAMDIPTFFGVHPVSEDEAYVAGLEGRVSRTTDGGETWKFVEMDVEFPIVDPLYTPFILEDGSGWAVGSAGEVVHRAAGEDVWKRADLGMSIYTWLREIDFIDSQNGWVVGGFGTILRTDDGGESWRVCLG